MTGDVPEWRSLEANPVPGWFRDATFGVYFHWGPYSVPAYDTEWYPREMYRPESDVYAHHRDVYGDPAEYGYREFIPEFDGANFDPAAWVRRCARAGADFVGVTAIHHDGFALWDSELTDWNAAQMGPERDVVGELAAAAREREMQFAVAFHHAWTWWYYPRAAEYDTTDPAYAGLYGPPHEEGEDPPETYFADWRDKVLEVVHGYRPDLLWFDFGWGNEAFLEHDRYRREVVAEYYDAARRWGKPVGVAHKRNLPVGVGIVDYERRRREDLSVQPWLTDTSIDRTAWGYVEGADYKSAQTVVEGLVDRASKNGTTLLNVGPKPDGTIPGPVVDRLDRIGDWVDRAGEAVTAARPWWTPGEGPTEVTAAEFEEASAVEFTGGDVRFTRTDDAAYAVLMAWPADGTIELATSLNRRLTGRDRGDVPVVPDRVRLVGTDDDLDWEVDGDRLRLHLPATEPADLDYAYPLRFDLSDTD